ncbi:TetR/AcrR family transcriptional regulator [Frankia sp. ACN1ag]|uniref:TetR/AcrR family transcriptional regulator n=1 Tax=Frankia sp. ACN1ag TaxID=102891 RepID=UPI001F3743F1|nr:TetR/AcrR family transcriptional regulator [Frankia sp. ACN1ag]
MTTSEMRRSDARRNHERVVRAAVEVFSELGLSATVPDVAARAGVGKATVYRNFPSRDELLTAVVERQLRWFDTIATTALHDPDPAAGFEMLIMSWFDRIVANRLVQDVMRMRTLASAEIQIDRITTLVDQVVVRAQRAGAVRLDVTPADLRTMMSGCAQRLVETGQQDIDSRLRFTRLILDAFRPPATPATPATPAAPAA